MALVIERVLESRFELTLDGGSVISSSENRMLTTDGYCDFKTGNGANILKKQRIHFSEVTIIDTFGGTGTFTNFSSVGNLWLKLIELNFFAGVGGNSGGVGVTRFDALLDAFQYYGNDGKVPIVDEDQLKLIPTQFYNYNNIIQLDDVAISSLVNGKYLKVELVEGVPKVVLGDVNTASVSNTMNKIEFIAEEGDTEIPVDNSPSSIFVFKNGSWLIEDTDFTYAAGIITLTDAAYENDYFEIIPLSSNVKKYPVTATTDNQTEFNFNGNPAFADAYLKGSRLREGIDYTRTLFSTGNKIVIINQYLIDDIQTGDVLEIITY